MSTILLSNFSGILPRTGDTGLPNNLATVARNVKLQSGEIRPWSNPSPVYNVEQEGVSSIFKMEGSGGTSLWCTWKADTDVVYGPVADNGEFRIYYSEGGVCKKTNWELCSEGRGPAPRNWYYMGVPAPEKAPKLTAVRVPNDKDKWAEDYPDEEYEEYSADNTDNRAYVYTYVAEFGSITEESAPSPAAEVVCDTTGGSVEISEFADPPTDHYNITRIRIYRAVTGKASIAYMLVDEVNLKKHKFPEAAMSLNGVRFSNSTYPDSRRVEQLGKGLDSMTFSPPPENLTGIVSMPNGFLAGFVNNQVWFSEPYLPHAWPVDYMLTTDSPIVGLGVYGNTLVVATTKQPYTISGTHPGAMSQEKQPMSQPCVSKRSIAYDQYGVLYASAYGLVAIAGGQMDVFTRPIITQDAWQTYNPPTMQAAMYNNLYVVAYRQAESSSMLVFSRGDEPALVNYDFTPTAMHVERGTGRLYCLREEDNKIYLLDGDPINMATYEWQSKRFVNPYWTSFSAMKLDADYRANDGLDAWEENREELIALNKKTWADYKNKSLLGDVNAATANTFEINGSVMVSPERKADFRSVQVTLYGDGKEVYSRVFTSIKACRIPAVRAYSWQVRFTGNVPIRSFVMGTTMKEVSAPN